MPRSRASSPHRLCIATLLRGAAADTVCEFVAYHQRIGFEHIFLFFDDPLEECIERLMRGHQGVTTHICDESFWRRRLASSKMVRDRHTRAVFEDTANCWRTEVQSRQNLCAEMAIERAQSLRLDWLLHIDIDEAFLPSAEHPADFFAGLPPEVEQVYLPNLEAQPESSTVTSWWRQVRWFKPNPALVSDRRALDAAWSRLHEWRRQHVPGTPETSSFFNAYVGGKSAVRLARDPLPYDVHKFLVSGELTPHRAPRTREMGAGGPAILHYANCGLENWLDKYALLGDFPDSWWGRVPIRLPMHLCSRDVQRKGRAEAARFYESVVVGDQAGEHEYLKGLGLLKRIDFVASALT